MLENEVTSGRSMQVENLLQQIKKLERIKDKMYSDVSKPYSEMAKRVYLESDKIHERVIEINAFDEARLQAHGFINSVQNVFKREIRKLMNIEDNA